MNTNSIETVFMVHGWPLSEKIFPYGVTKESVDELINLALTDRAQLSVNFSQMLLYGKHSDAIKNWFRDLSLSASLRATVMSGYALRDEDSRQDLCSIQVPIGIFL